MKAIEARALIKFSEEDYNAKNKMINSTVALQAVELAEKELSNKAIEAFEFAIGQLPVHFDISEIKQMRENFNDMNEVDFLNKKLTIEELDKFLYELMNYSARLPEFLMRYYSVEITDEEGDKVSYVDMIGDKDISIVRNVLLLKEKIDEERGGMARTIRCPDENKRCLKYQRSNDLLYFLSLTLLHSDIYSFSFLNFVFVFRAEIDDNSSTGQSGLIVRFPNQVSLRQAECDVQTD